MIAPLVIPSDRFRPGTPLPLALGLVIALVIVAADSAAAAFTTGKCLIQKRQAWAALRKCEAVEDVKRLKGKAPDLQKCRIKLQEKLAKIDTKAVKAAVACRYGANGDATVTDYDTALMWETKNGQIGGFCFLLPDVINHCVNSTFNLDEAQAYVGPSADRVLRPFLAGYTDWRLPTVVELQAIFDSGAPGCGSGTACIDPIFGPTLLGLYWTATFSVNGVNQVVDFDGAAGPGSLNFTVRAVRDAF